MQKFDVDLRLSMEPTQSVSKYECKVREEVSWRDWPWCNVPLSYRNILLTTHQRRLVGECINWEISLTAKAMLGQVMVAYCKMSTTCQKRWGSSKGSLSWRERRRCCYGGIAWFGIQHAGRRKKFSEVFCLGEVKTSRWLKNFNAKEKMKMAQVFECKTLLERSNAMRH